MSRRIRSVQCCSCSKWVHPRCTLLSFSEFYSLYASHSWSFPFFCISDSPGDCHSANSFIFYWAFQHAHHCAQQPHTPSLMQLFPLILAYKHTLSLISPSIFFLVSLISFLLTYSGFFNGIQEVFVPEVLKFFTFFSYFVSILLASKI